MKTLRLLILFGLLGLCCAVQVYANGLAVKSGERGRTPATRDFRCTVAEPGGAPISWLLEDALAYALDIPLAMISPLTCLIQPSDEEADAATIRSPRRYKKK